MSTIVFPPSRTPAQATWELTHNVAGGSNPWGQVQRISRGSPVWSCSFAMPTLEGEDMAIFESFMAQAARGDVRFYMPHPEPLRGSFDNRELLGTNWFDGSTGWSVTSGETFTIGSRLARLAANDTGVTWAFSPNVALTAGMAVCMVADSLPGSSENARIQIVDGATGSAIGDTADTAPARLITSGLVVNTGNHTCRLRMNSPAAGLDIYWASASLSRCLLVNGASQSGSSLNVDAGDPSTNGLLKVGDMFTVMIDGVPSLHRLTRDLDTNSSGEGTLYFEPALPGSPADNAPIILRNPFCRMYIPSHNASSVYKPPMHGSFALEAVEDPTRP